MSELEFLSCPLGKWYVAERKIIGEMPAWKGKLGMVV